MNILVVLLVKSAGIVFAKNISYINTSYPTIPLLHTICNNEK